MCISVKQVRLECMIRFKIIDSYFRSSESSYLSYFFFLIPTYFKAAIQLPTHHRHHLDLPVSFSLWIFHL